MSTIRKLLLIPITILSHLVAEIHAEYLRVLGNKTGRNWRERVNTSVAKSKADFDAAKAVVEKAGMTVLNKVATEVQGAVAAAPVLPH